MGGTANFADYLALDPPAVRADPQNVEFANQRRPRIVSLIRSYEAMDGTTAHRVYLGTPRQRDPTTFMWSNLLIVRQFAGGLRGTTFFFGCARCDKTGSYDGFVCPYCRGTRWAVNYGERVDLATLGRQVAFERMARPRLPEYQADFDADEGLPVVTDLPRYPREIS